MDCKIFFCQFGQYVEREMIHLKYGKERLGACASDVEESCISSLNVRVLRSYKFVLVFAIMKTSFAGIF